MDNDFKESNKNLINLRTNLITIILVLTSGIMGLIYTDISFLQKSFALIPGAYFDLLFIYNVIKINEILDKRTGGK